MTADNARAEAERLDAVLTAFAEGGGSTAALIDAAADLLSVVRRTEDARCGAWGGCPLPRGHNMGNADIPSNHATAHTRAACGCDLSVGPNALHIVDCHDASRAVPSDPMAYVLDDCRYCQGTGMGTLNPDEEPGDHICVPSDRTVTAEDVADALEHWDRGIDWRLAEQENLTRAAYLRGAEQLMGLLARALPDRRELWEAIVEVRDAAPRRPDDADTEDIVDAVLDLLDRHAET